MQNLIRLTFQNQLVFIIFRTSNKLYDLYFGKENYEKALDIGKGLNSKIYSEL